VLGKLVQDRQLGFGRCVFRIFYRFGLPILDLLWCTHALDSSHLELWGINARSAHVAVAGGQPSSAMTYN
jgi:hypothetical protein